MEDQLISPFSTDSEDENNPHQLAINEHYAKAFQYRKEREELTKRARRHPRFCVAPHLADLFSYRVQSKKSTARMRIQMMRARAALIPSRMRAKTRMAKSSLPLSMPPSYARSHVSKHEIRTSTTPTATYSTVRFLCLCLCLCLFSFSCSFPFPSSPSPSHSITRFLWFSCSDILFDRGT
jgi:hypothetical protein